MNYKILTNDYINTGGHCMVGSCTAWLPDAKQVLYVYSNEEGVTVSTVDYINLDLDGEYDASWTVTALQIEEPDVTDEYFELMRDCLLEYVKRDCKHMSDGYYLHADLIPQSMLDTVSEAYLQYVSDEQLMIETDGFKIHVDDNYTEYLGQLRLFVKEGRAAALDCSTQFLDEQFKITFCNMTATVNNNAYSFGVIIKALEAIIGDEEL
jgi:hypothetical protein